MELKNINIENFIPLNDDVLIKIGEVQEFLNTDSGIVIKMQEGFEDRHKEGEVIEIGKDVKNVNVGDYVYWDLTRGIDIEFANSRGMTISSKNLLGKNKSKAKDLKEIRVNNNKKTSINSDNEIKDLIKNFNNKINNFNN